MTAYLVPIELGQNLFNGLHRRNRFKSIVAAPSYCSRAFVLTD